MDEELQVGWPGVIWAPAGIALTAAAGLGTRQFEGFTPGYATAEQQLTATGIGGAGQQTTNRAAELALAEAGYTPQQIQAMTGAQYMGAYQNPYEQQVVQGTLADIERQRLFVVPIRWLNLLHGATMPRQLPLVIILLLDEQ